MRSNLAYMSPAKRPAVEDPAGLDKLLLALGRAAHDFAARKLSRFGLKLDMWNGADGLEAVLQDTIREHGIPNKRLHDLVTPRDLAMRAGVLPRKKRRLAK